MYVEHTIMDDSQAKLPRILPDAAHNHIVRHLCAGHAVVMVRCNWQLADDALANHRTTSRRAYNTDNTRATFPLYATTALWYRLAKYDSMGCPAPASGILARLRRIL